MKTNIESGGMMKKLPIMMWAGLSSLAFVLSVSSVFAGNKDDGSRASASQAISFEEFKGRCEHPRDYDKQVAPENISISCTNVETDFVPEAPGVFALTSSRRVTAGVFSNKWHVGGVDAREVPVTQRNGSCLRYKEVERTLTESRQVSCAEVLSLKGDLDDYCTSVLDTSKAQHPKLIETKETGHLVDTCTSVQAQVQASGKAFE